MNRFLLFLYHLFHRKKTLAGLILLFTIALMIWSTLKISVITDISNFFPKDKNHLSAIETMSELKASNKIAIMIKSSGQEKDNNLQIPFAEALLERLSQEKRYFKSVSTPIDQDVIRQVSDNIIENLPILIQEAEYTKLDSILSKQGIEKQIHKKYQSLISPAGQIYKYNISKDVLGISDEVFSKLYHLYSDQPFDVIDGFLFTKDHQILLLFFESNFPNSDTKNNGLLVEELDHILSQLKEQYPKIDASYYGGAIVAVSNARQLHQDTMVTIAINILLLSVLMFMYFKNLSAPFLLLIPVVFGMLFSLSIISLIQGTISVFAIAAGSIIVGLTINYSLHFLTHLKHSKNIVEVIKSMAEPLLLGSCTTVLAFLSLTFAEAPLLHDIGLFIGLCLIGATLFTLTIFPHLLKEDLFSNSRLGKPWSIRLKFSPKQLRVILVCVLIITPFFAYKAMDVRFESDMHQLSYMSSELKESENTFYKINSSIGKISYLITHSNTAENTLQSDNKLRETLEELKEGKFIENYFSFSSWAPSDSIQKLRIERWNKFWMDRSSNVSKELQTVCSDLNFSPVVVDNFNKLISKPYHTVKIDTLINKFLPILGDYYVNDKGFSSVSWVMLDSAKRATVKKKISDNKATLFVDKNELTKSMIGSVNNDFTFIVTTTSLIVFCLLWLSYGRIELALLSFLPMFISWIWILGLMSILGITFNIVNVIVSTFIFGLGDDYTIFTMDGLLERYRIGTKKLDSVQEAVLFSALTTITGLGVLIFAHHPALRSVAAIAIVGIIVVVFMAHTIQPFLFDWLVTRRAEQKLPPMTMFGLIATLVIFINFVIETIVLTLVGIIFFYVVPFGRRFFKHIFHILISKSMRIMILPSVSISKRFINRKKEFDPPCVIIANHQSFVDIVFLTMLHSKVILITNSWVWKSPLFGWLVKMADYLPYEFQNEKHLAKLKASVEDGYSLVFFPEGTRSKSGQLKRFRKGAFYVAEKLKLDIQPILFIGTGRCIPKGSFYVQNTNIIVKYLNQISNTDLSYGRSYDERTKKIYSHYRTEFNKFSEEEETPKYFRHKLISQYIYKGPILEWYLRIKLIIEDYYSPAIKHVPNTATVLDLGCGYGFLSYLLHYMSPNRRVVGVDYDKNKIQTANHCYSRGENLAFFEGDVTTFPELNFDRIILYDLLHYLTYENQSVLLIRCFNSIPKEGKIIIRDGNKVDSKNHKVTWLSEVLSIPILGFNKSENNLCFLSYQDLLELCIAHNMEILLETKQKHTSNNCYIITHKK